MPKPPPNQSNDCALLVLSCDPYADLWPPFFALLRRHWPDCPFQILLGAGQSSVAPSNIHVLRSSAERDWSQCTLDYLYAMDQPYVLIMLDDFFLRRPVPTSDILQCFEFARVHAATQLRLIPRPGPTDRLPTEPNIGSCAAGSPYRLSTQAAIWDRMKLKNLLRAGESIWEFEHNANIRATQQPDGFFSVRKAVLPYEGFWGHHVIEKGKWLPHEKRIFAALDIDCDFSKRGTLPWGQTAFNQLAKTVNHLIGVLPWRVQIRVKRSLKFLLRPFMGKALDRLGQTPANSRL
jgi:hypothetical protein